MVVATFQQRFGPKALRRFDAQAQPPKPAGIPTGFAALDRATGIGGIPRAQITELLGAPTSGMATLALRVMAEAQARGDVAVFIDSEQSFDPVYAAACGVNLERLALIRPQTPAQGLAMLPELVASGGVGILIYHSVEQLLSQPQPAAAACAANLRRLTVALHNSACAVLFPTPLLRANAPDAAVNYPPGLALPAAAALRLWLHRERWLRRRRDVVGYEAQVTVIGNKLAAAGATATIRITLRPVTGERMP